MFLGTASSLIGVGDANLDGSGDFVVSDAGWNDDTGKMWAYLGPVDGATTVDDAYASWQGEYPGSTFGFRISAAGSAAGPGTASFLTGGLHDESAPVTAVFVLPVL